MVAASGRVVLGDRGFRAARARVEARHPAGTAALAAAGLRLRAPMLAERYPDVRVYRSVRQMVREHPPDDLAGLGIGPADRTPLRCRRAALVLWGLFVITGYAVLLLPRDDVAAVAATWWPLLVLGVLAWQAALVALVVRSQARERAPLGRVRPSPRRTGRRRAERRSGRGCGAPRRRVRRRRHCAARPARRRGSRP